MHNNENVDIRVGVINSLIVFSGRRGWPSISIIYKGVSLSLWFSFKMFVTIDWLQQVSIQTLQPLHISVLFFPSVLFTVLRATSFSPPPSLRLDNKEVNQTLSGLGYTNCSCFCHCLDSVSHHYFTTDSHETCSHSSVWNTDLLVRAPKCCPNSHPPCPWILWASHVFCA